MAELMQYGVNPHPGVNVNADHGWGGYQWPGGVPAALLGYAKLPGPVVIRIRVELIPLLELLGQIAQVKYARTFMRGWTGGYDNRPIAGTNTPSNHSRGKAFDVDAAYNPRSDTFRSDLPPGLVQDFEACGFFWGGRYTGGVPYDPMHFEYIGTPADVAGDITHAKEILHAADPAEAIAKHAPEPDGWPAELSNPFDCLGLITGPKNWHGGDTRFDGPDVVDAIRFVQVVLNHQGFGPIPDNGMYFTSTVDAVVEWQQVNQLPVTGRVTHEVDWPLLRKLDADRVVPYPGPPPFMKGSTGVNVKRIQKRLNFLHLNLTADGLFGLHTEQAVRTYQQRNGLTVDGIVGPITWSVLWK